MTGRTLTRTPATCRTSWHTTTSHPVCRLHRLPRIPVTVATLEQTRTEIPHTADCQRRTRKNSMIITASGWTRAGRMTGMTFERNGRHMQEIMTRYNIPPSVPFDQVASGGYATGGYNNSNGVSAYPAYAPGRLSGDDQKKFDKYYKKWADARRKNDRDDIDENARHMEDIMAHYNIPANVPFDRIASPAAAYR